MEPIIESGEIIEPLRDRIVGRVALEDQRDYEGNVIVDINQEITEELAAAIQAAGIERVKIRSVLTCESKRGVCVACYGRNSGHRTTGGARRGGRRDRGAVHRRTRHPADHAYLPHRRYRRRVSASSRTQDAKSDGFARYIGHPDRAAARPAN